jgi:pimeloyl-ACP methyl ester carboxylesterase
VEFLETVDRARFEETMRARTSVRVPRRTMAAHLSAVFRHRTDDRLPTLDVPTMVVKPGRDVLIRPGESDRLKELLPNANLVVFEDAGHGVTFQRADALNARLLEHFAAHDH